MFDSSYGLQKWLGKENVLGQPFGAILHRRHLKIYSINITSPYERCQNAPPNENLHQVRDGIEETFKSIHEY